MKPIRLKLSGLNSYIEEQDIDFEKLTERGLFGIFGPTGSGKSTILDAITIAMYGQIPRNTRGFINSSSDRAVVSYEFEIGKGNSRRRYIVDRTIRMKKDGGLNTSQARLTEILAEEEKNVLADKATDVNKKITEVVGLTADDFTRSVVLPQGKFNDFLKLTGSDRRNMLERIFNLEKYGRTLMDKIRKNKDVEKQVLTELNGKLSQYENISQDQYEKLEIELNEIKNKEQELKINQVKLQDEYTSSKEIFENQSKLQLNIDRKKSLEEKKSDIEKKRIKLENAIKADKINPYIQSINNLEKSIREYSSKIEEIDKKLNMMNQSIMICEKNYKEALEIKNTEFGKLSEDKAKVENAIKIEKEVEKLEIELRDLRHNYKNFLIEKEQLEDKKRGFDSQQEVSTKKLKELESKMTPLKISAELKQNIFKAYELEKEYNVIVEDKKQKKLKYENNSKELDKLKQDYRSIEKFKKDIDEKVNNLIELQSKLDKKCPGDSNQVLTKSQEITNLRNKLDIAKENQAKKDEIQKQLNQILENKYKSEREIKVLSEKFESNQINTKRLNEEIEQSRYLNIVNEVKKQLKENEPCPVCGSTHHDNAFVSSGTYEIDKLRGRLAILEEEESRIKLKLEELKSENHIYTTKEQLIVEQLNDVKSKLDGIDINDLNNTINEEQKKLDLLKNNIDSWEKEKKKVDDDLVKHKEEKYTIDQQETKLNQNITNNKSSLKELEEEIEKLETKYNTLSEEYNKLRLSLKIENISKKVAEINKNEKEIEELEVQYSTLNNTKQELESKINYIQEKIHKLDVENSKLKDVGEAKKSIKEDKCSALLEITKGEKAVLLLQKIEERIELINKNEQNTRSKLETETKERDITISQKSSIDGSLKQANEQLSSQSDTLKNMLLENRFDDIYTVQKFLMDKESIEHIHNEVTSYEEETKTIDIKIKDLKEKLNGRTISKERYEELGNMVESISLQLAKIIEVKGAKQQELNNLREALEKVKDIVKQHKEIQHKVDLLEELDKSIQGNKFVEYVATNQLKYIAIEASKRLKDITKGRYALELDATGNFVMRDDFNGGVRRSVDTLSGGETFLTSLSLALALSSQIQLKGSAPLEFFFLDEGFGTLDSDLLEIVMQSLERLHSDRLSVGIISHVEELKNRVPVKLVVKQSEAGIGSKVKIEYS